MNHILIATLLSAVISGEADQRTVAVEPDGRVEINNVSGTIRVRTHDAAEVRLSASVAHGAELIFERHGSGAVIRVENKNCNGGIGGTDLVVHIPRRASLRINGVSADVDIEGGDGELDVQTVSGDVRATSGASRVRIKTVSGDSTLALKKAALDLATVSGELVVNAEHLSDLRVRSVSGDVRVKAQGIEGDGHKIKVQSARVTLSFPKSVPVRVNVRSFRDRRVLGDSEASAQIEVDAFNGDVELERS